MNGRSTLLPPVHTLGPVHSNVTSDPSPVLAPPLPECTVHAQPRRQGSPLIDLHLFSACLMVRSDRLQFPSTKYGADTPKPMAPRPSASVYPLFPTVSHAWPTAISLQLLSPVWLPLSLWESPLICPPGRLLWLHTACSVAQGLLACSVALPDHPGQVSAVTLLFVFTKKTTIYMRLKTVSLIDLKIFVCVGMFICVCM